MAPVTRQKSARRLCAARSHELLQLLVVPQRGQPIGRFAERAAAEAKSNSVPYTRRGRRHESPAAAWPSCSTAPLHRLRPAQGDERQYLLDQPSGLRQHFVVATRGRTQDEFGDPGLDIGSDPLEDRARVADRKIVPRVTPGTLVV